MRRQRFLIALPRDPSDGRSLSMVGYREGVRTLAPAIWHDGGTRTFDLGNRGVVLGTLFSRSDFRMVGKDDLLSLAGRSATATAHSLVTSCWGGYLAVLRDSAGSRWKVLRDPSGHLPVYRLAAREHVYLSTDPELLSEAQGQPLRVSFEAVRSHLLRPQLRTRSTCLDGLDELVPGTLTDPVHGADPGMAIWHETDFLPRESSPGFDEAAGRLRELSTSVMGAWSSCFGQTAVAASGGVDSSFICAALARNGAPFDCVTVTTGDPSGDERRHARRLADSLGVACAEKTFEAALFNPASPASAGLPSPARRSFVGVLDRLLDQARCQGGATVVLDGNGGDNLFCFLHSAAPVVDRWRAEGPGFGVMNTFIDMCRITGCSVPTMARAAWHRASIRQPVDHWLPDPCLLVAGNMHDDYRALTPWTARFEGRRSGKHDHLALIMRSQNHIHGLTTPVERFSPLASQPIVEFCLGIPSWTWARGGINRALARAASAGDIPPSLLARTSKAGPDSFLHEAFATHRTAIAERLLHGLLAAHGVIDCLAVRQAIDLDQFRQGAIVGRVLDLLEAENWCRSWS